MAAPQVDLAEVRKQLEYYLSNDNLKRDEFFHDFIAKSEDVEISI